MKLICMLVVCFSGMFFVNSTAQADAQPLASLLQQGQENLTLGHYYQANQQLRLLEEQSIQQQDDYTATLAKGLQGYSALQQQDNQLAEQLLTSAFNQARQKSWHDLQVRFALYLGQLQDRQQNPQQARGFFEQALLQASQISDKSLIVSAWYQLAKLSLDENQPKKASEQLMQAKKLLESLPVNSSGSELWLNIGYQALRLHQQEIKTNPYLSEAFSALRKALAQAEQFAQLRQQASALKYLAQLYKEQRPLEAIKLLQSGINAAQKADANDLLIDLEWQIGQLYQRNNDDKPAIAAYREAVKSIESIRIDIPVSYEQGRSSFRETFAPIYLSLANLLLKQTHLANSAQQQVLLQEAQDTIELMKKSELEDYFQSRCEIPLKPINLQKTDPHAVAIYPISLLDRLEIIVDTAAGLYQFTQTVTAKDLEQQARDFSSQLRNPLSDAKKSKQDAQVLYQWLINPIKPLLEQQQIQTLIYIPDGVLRLVPLAALYDGKKFLIENYAVVNSVGMSLVDSGDISHKSQQMLLAGMSVPGDVIADLPEFLLEQLVDTAIKTRGKRQLTRDLKLRVGVEPDTQNKGGEKKRELRELRELLKDQLVVAELKSSLALPGVEAEIKQLASQNAVPYLLNEDFSLSNFIHSAETQPYKILHIASHGFFGSSAEDSFIMTHDKVLNMNRLEAFLNSEYFRLNPIDLITLSACQTAEGDDRSPLGISGIAIKSKVHSALGSLWSVADEATAQLMSTFYQGLKIPGLSKAKALQQAEISLLRQEKFSNPAFWAPFILVGDWR